MTGLEFYELFAYRHEATARGVSAMNRSDS
jgi:hypothetical protein